MRPDRRERRGRRRHRGRSDPRPPAGQPDLSADVARLAESLRPFSIDLRAEARARLVRFGQDLLQWNDRLNLLSRPDAPYVIRKHVAASLGILLVARRIPGERWIDVGTGAGFPGLVLKITQPELDISLLESARKRCIFLDSSVRTLGLGRVPILALRAETMIARGEGVGEFSVLTVRAVTTLEGTLNMFSPFVAPGGRVITFKGPAWKQEIEQAESSGTMTAHGFTTESVTRIPWTSGHIVVLRKSCPPRN